MRPNASQATRKLGDFALFPALGAGLATILCEFLSGAPILAYPAKSSQLSNVPLPANNESLSIGSTSSTSLNLSEVYSDLYTLGPGDSLSLSFLDPELKNVGGNISILSDGTVILPLIGSVQLSGLTVGQATRWLRSLYSKQVVRPDLILQLISSRPVRITVIGEITRPGLYELGAGGGGGIPRVVKAIQSAGGITPNADIRRVLLRRVVGQNGAQKQTFLDLAQVFLVGNQFQNPVLFDGDTIVVGRSSEPIPDEVIRIGRTNLAPANISVSILGEVKSPGTVSLPANTPLIEAIFRAGGLRKWRANKNHIEIIRFNDNGTTTRQVFSYKDDLNVSNAFNPPLRDRDTIIVNRTFYGETLDALNDIAVPLGIINNLGGFGGGGGWGWNNNYNR
jgi:polysaccharide export outer membrane protein